MANQSFALNAPNPRWARRRRARVGRARGRAVNLGCVDTNGISQLAIPPVRTAALVVAVLLRIARGRLEGELIGQFEIQAAKCRIGFDLLVIEIVEIDPAVDTDSATPVPSAR